MKWKMHQIDVKITLLNDVVEEEVYMEQPLGFDTCDMKTHVYKLKNALYGLKQTPMTWYNNMDRLLTSLGFAKSKEDFNLYFKVECRILVILLLYVDHFLITREEEVIKYVNRRLVIEF